MANTLQPNPSDATASFSQPDWNSKNGQGVATAGAYNATRDTDDIYDSQRNGERERSGHGSTIKAATVSSLSPATGTTAGGTVVTINGDNFTGATGVTFGGTAGTAFSVKTDNKIQVTAPAHSSGAVNVVVATDHGNVTKTSGYTYA